MARLIINKRPFVITIFPIFGLGHRNDATDEITPMRIGIDKVKDFFRDENGNFTDETQSIINATTAGFLAGFMFGAMAKIRNTIETFVRENQATKFHHQNEARKLLFYKTSAAMFVGGMPFGFKVGTFCFLFTSASAVLLSYQGKFHASQHIIAGAVAGSIYKMNMGLKGAFAGGVLGSILGGISGITVSLILYVTGVELGDLHKAANNWVKERNRLAQQASGMKEETKQLKEYCEEKNRLLETNEA